jgi:hypothetical protein
MGRTRGHLADKRYRNVNGVYMKLTNFRRFDPAYTSAGKVGLTHGNREEEAVWREFSVNPGPSVPLPPRFGRPLKRNPYLTDRSVEILQPDLLLT